MQTSGSLIRPVASNFGLHICLSVSVFFVPFWWALTFALLIYKGSELPYPPTAFGFEIVICFALWIIQYWGVKIGKRGNMTESTSHLAVGLVFLFVNCIGCAYYSAWQTYVMRIDRGFSLTLLCLNILCLIFGIVAFVDILAVGSTPAEAAANKRKQHEEEQRKQEQLAMENLRNGPGGDAMQQQQFAAAAAAAAANGGNPQQNQQQQNQQQFPPGVDDGNNNNMNNNNNNNNFSQQQQDPQMMAAMMMQQQPQGGNVNNNNSQFQQQQSMGGGGGDQNMAPPPGVG